MQTIRVRATDQPPGEAMAAVAVATLTCCANSHPFQERHVTLAEPLKVGRSVAQMRPAQNNAIFDCKVLSRNHAILWYENGKFYVQDTKSSNGTFVNSQRLSKGSEESAPFELCSNDTIQFGVDVVENSRKVTHSCIIATVQLFHPDGREAVRIDNDSNSANVAKPVLQSQELYQIAQYIQEAQHREQMLENKLATLQTLIENTREDAGSSWRALIDEDQLLSRLGLLENQLTTYAKNQSEDSLRAELSRLQADKFGYENTAKEALQRVLEEKLEAMRRLADLERSLNNAEDECLHYQMMYETSQSELQQLAEKYENRVQDLHAFAEKFQEVEQKQMDELEDMERVKMEFQSKLEEFTGQEDRLIAKVEALQAECDFTNEQLNNVKMQLETTKKSTSDLHITDSNSLGVQVDLINLLDLRALQTTDGDDANSGDECETDEVSNVIETKRCIPETQSACRYVCQVCSSNGNSHDMPDNAMVASSLTSSSDHKRVEELLAELEQTHQLVTSLKLELGEAHELASKAQAETEILRSQLESKTTTEHSNATPTFEEYKAAKDECSLLQQRVADLENEIKRLEHESTELRVEYGQLHQSYHELEALKDEERNLSASSLTPPVMDIEARDGILCAEKCTISTDMEELRNRCAQQDKTIESLKQELQAALTEYGALSSQSRSLSTCVLAPFIVLLIAVLIAFYPLLSWFTVTLSPPGTS